MNSDDIIRSFLNLHPDTPMDSDEYIFSLREIKQVVEAAVKAERYACAKVCEDMGNTDANMNKTWRNGCFDTGFAIRARGQE